MTTMVDSEVPPRRPQGKRLLLVAVTLVAATGLVIAGACALDGDEPDPGPPSAPSQSHAPYIADASFVLQNYGTLTTEAVQFWQDLTIEHVVSLGLPFTRYNRYYTRFFLKDGETVEILMEANVPLGASMNTGLEGISIMLIPGSAPYEQSQANIYLPPTESDNGGYFRRLERMGGNWQVGWAITAQASDYYWLILTNTARQDAWCHFTINVPAG